MDEHFDPSGFFAGTECVGKWRSSVEPFLPFWVTKWLEHGDHNLQPMRRQKLIEGKLQDSAQRSASWLGYLVEMSSFYGYSSEGVILTAAEAGGLPPVELQTFKVQDLSAYFPLHLSRDLFALPYYRIPGTGMVSCAVLEPAFIPYIEELLSWVRGRWMAQTAIPGSRPAVFQYFLGEPKAFSTFLGSLERAQGVRN